MWSNKHLRDFQNSNSFQKTVLNMPQYKGKLWRGELITVDDLKMFKKGTDIVLDYNTSFSYNEEIAISVVTDSNNLISVIYEATNAQGADIGSFDINNEFKSIGEIIIPKGSKFRITEIKQIDDIDKITQLSDKPVPGFYIFLNAIG